MPPPWKPPPPPPWKPPPPPRPKAKLSVGTAATIARAATPLNSLSLELVMIYSIERPLITRSRTSRSRTCPAGQFAAPMASEPEPRASAGEPHETVPAQNLHLVEQSDF